MSVQVSVGDVCCLSKVASHLKSKILYWQLEIMLFDQFSDLLWLQYKAIGNNFDQFCEQSKVTQASSIQTK